MCHRQWHSAPSCSKATTSVYQDKARLGNIQPLTRHVGEPGDGGVIVPLNDDEVLDAQGRLDLANSSLSEMAMLGVCLFLGLGVGVTAAH